METVVVTERDDNGRMVVEIIDDELAYDTMEQLVDIIGERFNIEVTRRADGIDERVWFVNINKKKFVIEYDELAGFDIIPKKNSYDELVREIGAYLSETIKT